MKKWTKKLVWLLVFALLTSACLFSFTACDDEDDDDKDSKTVEKLNGKTAAEIYAETMAQMSEALNYEMDGEMLIDMTMKGQGVTVSMTMEEEIVTKMNGDSLYMKMAGETVGMGEDGTNLTEVWFVDGVCYTHVAGTGMDTVKGKMTMSKDDFMGSVGEDGASTMIELEASYLEGAKFRKDGDGYYVKINVTGEEVAQIVGDVMAETGMDMDFTFDNLVYKLFFDADGTMTGGEASFTMSATVEGFTVEATATMEFDYELGTVGTIEPPTDANSYVDMTGQI